MDTQKRFELFKERAIEIHGNKFDYSQSIFINQKLPIKIICTEHGEFYQCPDKHISKNAKGCVKCWNVIRKGLKRVNTFKKPNATKEYFLAKADKKFKKQFKYDLSAYKGITKGKITITCPLHGLFYTTPLNHLQSSTGCYQCGLIQKNQSKTVDYEKTIQELESLYSGKYHYPEYNKETYKTRKSVIDIICKKHGLFRKKVQKHLSGQGCFHCRVDEMIDTNILVGGYSEKLFADKPEIKNESAILYYLEINNGQFYKIGITRTSTKNRIKGIISKSKGEILHVKTLKEVKNTLYNCFKKEQRILKQYDAHRIYTSWSTELFDTNVLF
jgi:hypothetical protein